MYGWLLESVQHFIVQECGEEMWETILREAGARNTIFSATQQYPDALMLRLASALARFVSEDMNSPTTSKCGSPAPKKSSLKSKTAWKSASVHNDNRQTNFFKCPFTATNALTAATKKEIDDYNSSEEIKMRSTDKINEREDIKSACKELKYERRSLGVTFESQKEVDAITKGSKSSLKIAERLSSPACTSSAVTICPNSQRENWAFPKESSVPTARASACSLFESTMRENVSLPNSKVASPIKEWVQRDIFTSPGTEVTSPLNERSKCTAVSTYKPLRKMSDSPFSSQPLDFEPKPHRKVSCTVALDVYRGDVSSSITGRRRLNSLNILPCEKLMTMREKFGTPDKVMLFFGRCFVKFFSFYGYDTMIRATGRYFCTFLQSVDSIHQRMRFTFPRMRSPSMQLTRAHLHGAELVYSSGRTGFTHYLMGQLYEIAEDIFSLKLRVTVVKEFMDGPYYTAVLRLEFDNNDYVQSLMLRKTQPCLLPAVPATLLLELFPFGVMLDRKMRIIHAGAKLVEAWGGPYRRITKTCVTEVLRLRKPHVPFTWDKVVCMQTIIFEIELMRYKGKSTDLARRGSQGAKVILLRGPIHFLEEIDALIFLCSPIFNDLEELQGAGLYLADLNGHGLSKEMLLHGWQHLSRLELLFEKAESRSMSLEKSCRLLDQWKKRSDQLLYSMIPKSIVEHLRAGKDLPENQQDFDCVTIIFCGVELNEAGSREDVMQTVAYMNDVYSKIDRLLDAHKVYKVETVGTVYLLVAGAPERTRAHASNAASAALAIARSLPKLTIGIHSGPVRAAVLGRRLPRYCLVGDTVNTASRMQTTSEPGRIQISAATKDQLPPGRFRLRRRGLIKVKGKGMMETYWLEGEVEEDEQQEALQLFSSLVGDN